MKIEDNFRVEVPVDEAWKVLLDLERIAPCLPGAQLTEVEGDEYRGTVKIKVGPITAQYKGVAKIEEADEANRKVVLQAEGRDTRGQGNASATVVATLVADGDAATTVNIDTDLNITGKVAQFGRGVLGDVSNKLLGQFADNLKKDVLSGTPTAPDAGGRRGADRPGHRSLDRHRRAARSTPASRRRGRRTPARARSSPRRPSPLTSWTRPVVRWGSGWCRSWPDWSWWWRSGRSSRGASGVRRTAAASATTPTDPRRIELVFDPAGGGDQLVLGIDPGVSRCGYGVVRRDGSQFRAVAYGVIRTSPSEELPTRLATLLHEINALIEEFTPIALAVERVLFQVNTRTAMSVGQASGLALALAGRAGIPVVNYSPNEVKLAVAGDGGAGKFEVQQMVMRLLQLRELPDPPDAADALALALCHWWRAPLVAQGAVAGARSSKLDDAIAAALAKDTSMSKASTSKGVR